MCDVKNYRNLMDGAVEYLNCKTTEWSLTAKVIEDIPEDAQGRILQVTGHSKLLLNKRLREFGNFLDDVSADRCDNVVTNSDLQGLWELIDIQMEKLRSMFDELEILKMNNWEEQKVEATKEKRQPLGALNKNGPKVPATVVRKDLATAISKQRFAAFKEQARQMRNQETPEQLENPC